MKRIKSRAASALILAALLMAGMLIFVLDYVRNAGDWVSFPANENIYKNGRLAAGRVYDRNGVLLASGENGEYSYAENALTRLACLHAVGDFEGNIGTGALAAFSDRLSGYSISGGVSEGGGEIKLTIDSHLNEIAYSALNGRRGAVLLSNYRTGEILCMVSAPAYDPSTGFDENDSAYAGAYINRCLSSVYTPGSVFKLVTLAAALENIDDIYDRHFDCAGSLDINGIKLNCTGWHGSQTIEQALANSCNCAFAQISMELGADILAEYAKKLGFCTEHEVSGISTRAGSFEKAAERSADLAWSGIGQYTDLICPYSMLRYVSAVANGGTAVEGSLLLNEKGGSGTLLSQATAGAVKDMMSYTVAYAYGSSSFPGLRLCAKSGTAELGDGTSNAWFTGFLDDEEHPYAFAVIIEQGGGGLKNAGALANTLLQEAVKIN